MSRTAPAGSPAEHSQALGGGLQDELPLFAAFSQFDDRLRVVFDHQRFEFFLRRFFQPFDDAAGDLRFDFRFFFELFGQLPDEDAGIEFGEAGQFVELPVAVFFDQSHFHRLLVEGPALESDVGGCLAVVGFDFADLHRIRVAFAALRFFFAFLDGSAAAGAAGLLHEGLGLRFLADRRVGAGRGFFDRAGDLVFVAFAAAAAGGEAKGEGEQKRRKQRQVRLSQGRTFQTRADGGRKLQERSGAQPRAEERPVRGSIFATSAEGPLPPSSRASRCSTSAIRSESALIASAIGSGRWIQSASGPSTLLPSSLTGWPGLPTTVAPGGTSSTTTVLAPIFAPSPTAIGPSSFAPEPTVTLSPRVGCRLPRWKPVPPRVTPW